MHIGVGVKPTAGFKGLEPYPFDLRAVPGIKMFFPNVNSTIQTGPVISSLGEVTNANHAWVSGGGNRPGYLATGGPGGRAAMTFNGSSQLLVGDNTCRAAIQNVAAFSSFIVWRTNTLANQCGITFSRNGSNTAPRFIIEKDASNFDSIGGRRGDADSFEAVPAGSTMPVSDTWVISVGVINADGKDAYLYRNGSLVASAVDTWQAAGSGSFANTLPTACAIGATGGGTLFLTGRVACAGYAPADWFATSIGTYTTAEYVTDALQAFFSL